MASLPPEPRVIAVMRDFKQALLLREASEMQLMAQRWLEVEQALEAQITALARQVAEMETPTESQVFRLARYRALLQQAQGEFEEYAAWATREITAQQAALAELGLAQATSAIEASYWPGMAIYFDRLPVGAIEQMIGLAGNGAPIGELLRLRMVLDAQGQPLPGVWERLTRTLINGTALGQNPRVTARLMRDDLAAGLQKALVIARTEQLRVYRQAAIAQYQASGVVRSQKRLTAHDSRVCAACIADEGTVYPITAPIPDHPNGRCTGVPVVAGMPEVRWLSGEAWLRTQSEEVQQGILGGGWDLWQSGAVGLGAFTTHTYSSEWGGGLQVTPVGALEH